MKKDILQQERNRLNQKQDADFVARNYPVKIAMLFVIYPVVALWSAFTAGGHLYTHFANTFNSLWIALVATIILAVGIEVGKIYLGVYSMKDIYAKFFSEGRVSIIAFLFKFSGAILVFYFSITLSIKGGPVVADFWKNETSPPELIDSAPIDAKYDGLIAQQESIINDARGMTWKGVIVRKGQAIILDANKEIKRLNQERAEALRNARNENKNIVADWETETATAGQWFLGFAGLGELLAIIILVFCVNYESSGETSETQLQTERNGYAQPFDVDSFTETILSRLQPATAPQRVSSQEVDKTRSGMLETAFGGRLRNDPKRETETPETKPILEAKRSEAKPPETQLQTGRNVETATVSQPHPQRGKTGLVIKNKKVLHNDKWFDLSQVKSNYRASKSKAKKYREKGDLSKEKEWKNKAATWLSYAQEIEEATHID